MFTSSFSKPVLAAIAFLALAGCKSDAERAEEYFQSGMELVSEGDVDRALVQFRNVFEFDGTHLATRKAMAEIFLERGNVQGAYRQYLAAAEHFPEDLDARRALAELAFAGRNWDEFTRHGAVAVQLAPEDPAVQVIDLGMKYREAVLAEDGPALDALDAPALALLEVLPDSVILNNLLIDRYVRDGALDKAMVHLDRLIAGDIGNRQLYNQRLAMLAQMQDAAAIEVQLREMVALFPGDAEVQGMLLRYYVSQRDLEKAESFLREISSPSDEDPALFLSLIQFLSQTSGPEAARVEIERAIAENPRPSRFRAMLALMDFQAGERDSAIADMEAILAAEPAPVEEGAAPEDLSSVKTTLARMLVNTGNQVGARRLVEEVLAEDSVNVDALKMQASWQLQADETDAAIANLRLALDTAPEDVQAMNLMYEAYTRTGDSNLARDFLALAVEASGNAPEQSLRYARLLIQEERFLPAEDVLLPSLRLNAGNVELLSMLGELYLRLEDIPRATQVIDTLRRVDTEQSIAIANTLQAQVLNQEGGTEEAIAFIENLASGENADLRTRLALLRARMATGETGEALTMAEEMVAENPDNLGLKQVLASAQSAAGDMEGAKMTLRAVTTAAPANAVSSWLQLIRISARQGEPTEALIEEALAATNNNPNLMWAKASALEQRGEYDAAIDIYQTLYEQNSSSVVIANNLASMLTTYRDDDESLEQAWIIARRLRDADVPAFQDTYGWIAFRRGNPEEALPYLESAAAGLPADPVVQIHLGLTYAALERNQDALDQMQKAVDIAGPADTRPRIEEARSEITRLRALVEN